jgi:hypothetical protein
MKVRYLPESGAAKGANSGSIEEKTMGLYICVRRVKVLDVFWGADAIFSRIDSWRSPRLGGSLSGMVRWHRRNGQRRGIGEMENAVGGIDLDGP